MSEHQIPDPPGPYTHVPTMGCACRPQAQRGRRADGSYGQVVVHHDGGQEQSDAPPQEEEP